MNMNIKEHPHRRFNPLTGEWVLVSPHRTRRPWQGKQETNRVNDLQSYNPDCYLCPGNVRANGDLNPQYESTFVFTNDFAALIPDSPEEKIKYKELFITQGIQGTSRVICFSPRHDLTLPEMEISDIRKVINVWENQFSELSKIFKWVQIFENKGEIMGCSNPHPHGQIWAASVLPNEPNKELVQQREYFIKNKSCLLIDYLEYEIKEKERIVLDNDYWVVIVPFWAVWPFETILLPKEKRLSFIDLSNEEKDSLAEILKRHLTKYDNLFNTSFPYTMGWHPVPNKKEECSFWQLHAHFYPPLLRSADIKKFMVGYEMLSEAQRDITPEEAAVKLRKLSSVYYRKKA
ncbi:UDP-glucose--hexose-1-phosphate uridylyltransferase [Bacteroidota bacterium]